MEKPFDLVNLEERLKAKGLTAVEGLAEIVSGEVLAWAKESCLIHPNAIVKLAGASALDILEPIVKGYVDKIDGVPG